MVTVVLVLQTLVCLELVQKGTRRAMSLWLQMVKIWLWALQTMDSLSESGKDVVLHRSMDMHGDTGHHLQSALLSGPAMMEEEMTDGTVSIGKIGLDYSSNFNSLIFVLISHFDQVRKEWSLQ
jgi:hypothetical protein